MKTKIMMVVVAGMIINSSSPAVAQRINSDSISGDRELYPPITIPWQHPIESEAVSIMEESMIYDLATDSANYRKTEMLENVREDDHCEEVKTDLSSTCASDYKFINEPVTIQ